MANIKSMKKDLRRNAKARAVNQGVKSALKTYVKKVRAASAAGDSEAAGTSVHTAVKALDKAAQRGIIHKNQAARRKSRAMKAANKAGATAVVAPKPKKEAAPKAAKAPAAKKPAAKKPAATKAKKAE